MIRVRLEGEMRWIRVWKQKDLKIIYDGAGEAAKRSCDTRQVHCCRPGLRHECVLVGLESYCFDNVWP